MGLSGNTCLAKAARPETGSVVVTDFRVARERVMGFLRQNPIPALAGMEEAAVSHWIQNPRDSVYADFRDIFAEAVMAGTRKRRSNLVAEIGYQNLLFKIDVPFPPPKKPVFTFIDLFAGIGGFRIAMQNIGGQCVFSSEWDKAAQKTYEANFGEIPFGDITRQEIKDMIPDGFDVLCAGFPCQPFSIAGVSKKNALGLPHGFECVTQGTLFFDVAKIISTKRPKAFLLENVKNLVSHNQGNTFEIILNTLEKELGYNVFWKIIDGQSWVPQHRERIIIVGFKSKNDFSWDDLDLPKARPVLKNILHPMDGTEPIEFPYTTMPKGKMHSKYTLTDHLWTYLQNYAEKHRTKGNGFGFGLVTGDDVARTLSARYYKDGSEILVSCGKGKNPRRLTPRECARLMGFSDAYKIVVSDTQAYRQFGNSVVVPVITAVTQLMKPYIQHGKGETEK